MGKCVKMYHTGFEERRILWCSSIAVFFGHAIDSGGCFFSFSSFAFLPFFPLLLDPFPKLGEVLQDTYL